MLQLFQRFVANTVSKCFTFVSRRCCNRPDLDVSYASYKYCNNTFEIFQLLQSHVAVVVPCCCNNMFMVFQLLQPNVAPIVPCCCNNMYMVFQLLGPNVAVVVFVLRHVFYSSFLCCSVGGRARRLGARGSPEG